MWSAAQVRRFAELLGAYGEAKFGDEWWPGNATSFIGLDDGRELARMCDEVDSLVDEPAILLSAQAIREHFDGDAAMDLLLSQVTDEEITGAAMDFIEGGAAEVWGRFDLWAEQIVKDAHRRRDSDAGLQRMVAGRSD